MIKKNVKLNGLDYATFKIGKRPSKFEEFFLPKIVDSLNITDSFFPFSKNTLKYFVFKQEEV